MKATVKITNSSIRILEGKEEIVGWHVDEWTEDQSIVPSIANAIKLAYTDLPKLKKVLGKFKLPSRPKQLAEALSYLKEGEGVDLEGDVFLVTGGLDGSDKCYGFVHNNGELLAITRGCPDGYPISDMDKDDLNYMFSGSDIFEKIKAKKYSIVDEEEEGEPNSRVEPGQPNSRVEPGQPN